MVLKDKITVPSRPDPTRAGGGEPAQPALADFQQTPYHVFETLAVQDVVLFGRAVQDVESFEIHSSIIRSVRQAVGACEKFDPILQELRNLGAMVTQSFVLFSISISCEKRR